MKLIAIATLLFSSISFAESIPSCITISNGQSFEILKATQEEYSKLIPSHVIDVDHFVTHPLAKEIGKRIENIYFQSLFRGMTLNNLSELRNIAVNGLEVSKTSFNIVYVSDSAGIALDYADGEKPFKTILIVDPTNLKLELQKSKDEFKYYSSLVDIPATNIKKVLLFDRNGNSNIPFCEISVEELKLQN